MNAKYHSNLKKIGLYTAENVSKIINHKEIHPDSIEDLDSTEVQEMIGQERCLLQHAVIVEMNAKYHSNLKKIGLYTAENVSKITDRETNSVD